MDASIWIGFDPREAAAFAVARSSLKRHLTQPIPIRGLVLADLIEAGLYRRPIECRTSAAGQPIMWDVISDAPMSTQHANARFLVPHLARMSSRIRVDSIGNPEPAYVDGPCSGWALFMDGDMLVRGNLARMFESLDRTKAVYCVQHRHEPQPGLKMDAQIQTRYARKNWSSFVAFNVGHPANKALTLELINSAPGRDLHRFCWLADSDIGELGPEWNYLVGITHAPVDPKVVHFTEGCPDMDGYHDVPFADEWNKAVNDWARGAMSFGT